MQTDRYGSRWPKDFICCPECGQPDNCGDCDHTPLRPDEVKELGGIPTAAMIHYSRKNDERG